MRGVCESLCISITHDPGLSQAIRMRAPYFTIGHSTRTVEQLVGLLHEPEIDLVVDVRSVPRSRAAPQFNGDVLPGRLAQEGIGYLHLRRLGGFRGQRSRAMPSPNMFWENTSFRNYADYAMTDEFRDGLGELRAVAHRHICAVMCAEAVWWRCHRRIIADYLIASGEKVLHVLGPGHIQPATMTPSARLGAGGVVLYPPREMDDHS